MGGRVLLERSLVIGLTLPLIYRRCKLSAATELLGLLCLAIVSILRSTPGQASPAVDRSAGRQNSYTLAMRRGLEERKQGDFAAALRDFESATRMAAQAHNLKDQASAINRQATCFIYLYQYRQALALADAALTIGKEIHDDEVQGISESNRATIYEQVRDYSLAESAARSAVAHLEIAGSTRTFVAALINLGDILSLSHQYGLAKPEFQKAVDLAKAIHASDLEAMAEDRRAGALSDAHDPAALSALQHVRQLYLQLHDDGAATMAQGNIANELQMRGDNRQALAVLNQLSATQWAEIRGLTPWWEPNIRGMCLLGVGRERQALLQFERAVRAAGVWRRSTMASDASIARTGVGLHEVYANYVSAATAFSIEDRNPALSRRALSVLMEERASTLREQMLTTLSKQMTLPPRYFEVLSQIQSAQAAVTLDASKDTAAKRAALLRLQNELADIENQAGLQGPSASQPNYTPAQSLNRVQKSLDRQELLLSFFLGKEKSYVWAITADKVLVYELPGENLIAAHAKMFSEEVRKGAGPNAGELLRQDLLAKLDPDLLNRPEWIVAADGALLDSVPFSILPERAGSTAPLIASHSLRFTPSELLLANPDKPVSNAYFIGVADPIYNLADSRLGKQKPQTHPRNGMTLARLVASQREVQVASRTNGFTRIDLLSGEAANGQRLRRELSSPPEVLHFAVHVVSPEDRDGLRGDEAGLALSIGPDGFPQLLTKEFISTLNVPGTLVVLSGCASQQGKPLPGAGMIGLSRAWLLAGASAVIVTAWPTPDDSGPFFGSFYSHLQAQPKSLNIARRAAAALQAAQLDMQHSPGFMSDPAFWAAYSLISKE